MTPHYARTMPTQMSGAERDHLRNLGATVRSLNDQVIEAEKARNAYIRKLKLKGVSPAEMGRVVGMDRSVVHRIIGRHMDRPSTRL